MSSCVTCETYVMLHLVCAIIIYGSQLLNIHYAKYESLLWKATCGVKEKHYLNRRKAATTLGMMSVDPLPSWYWKD